MIHTRGNKDQIPFGKIFSGRGDSLRAMSGKYKDNLKKSRACVKTEACTDYVC